MAMNAITLHTRTGRWAIRPITPDPLARVRDRALRDLVDDLEGALDALDAKFDLVVAAGLSHEAEHIHGVLRSALDYLVELRRAAQ
jgi:hypothetical protein